MPPSHYTDTQRAEALDLYVEHGPSEAGRRTGIPKGTITKWAKADGVETLSLRKTAEATEAAVAQRKLKRELLQILLLDKAVDMLGRMDEPHTDFKGKDASPVTYPKAPADACKSYATSAAILIDKLRLEEGQATERREVLSGEIDSIDAELARLTDELRGRAGREVPMAEQGTT